MTQPDTSYSNRIQIYVDMDGVLADFDTGYRSMIGPMGGKEADDVDWEKVSNIPGFYASLPPMPDFDHLWYHVSQLDPIILTGIPTSVKEALDNKRAWVAKHIGPQQRIIGCKSKDKSLHGKPGDVLIDDWEKYMHLWHGMGGHWITHRTASESVQALIEYIDIQQGTLHGQD
jgi:hypothetical protein